MEKIIYYYYPAMLLAGLLVVAPLLKGYSQCDPKLEQGQNLVENYDFSEGYDDWEHDAGYKKFTACNSGCYSTPGYIYAGTNADDFNNAFDSIVDHTPTSDNMHLMVDGLCETGVALWRQTGIPIEPNTTYYFEVWVTNLNSSSSQYGELAFEINGSDLGTTILADQTVGTWERFQATWTSGASPGPTATIEIVNTQTSGCSDYVDFAVDDITFTPGCEFGAPGPEPDLGPGFSLCGKSTPLRIHPHLGKDSTSGDITYTWFKDGTQIKSGTGQSYYDHYISSAGTYAVCVDSVGSCKKTDSIQITSDYSIDLGPDFTLCSPPDATLDAGYSGPGVDYQWYRNGTQPGGNDTSKTFYINNPGTYSVEVTDPSCGTVSDAVNVTASGATPNDTVYCPTSSVEFSVNGTGKYKWFTTATGTTSVGTGDSFTTTLSGGDTTFYAEDTSTFAMDAGPSPDTSVSGFSRPDEVNSDKDKSVMIFNAHTDFRLDSISVLYNTWWCDGTVSLEFTIRDQSGNIVGGAPVSYSFTCPYANSDPSTPPPPEGTYDWPNLDVQTVRVPIGLNIPEGNGYSIQFTGGDYITMFYNKNPKTGSPPADPNYTYPTVYSGPGGEDVVEFQNNASNFGLYDDPNAFPGYFDWKITKGTPCDRIPVQATENCAAPADWLSFDARPAKHGNVLTWSTSEEKNNKRFIVQRSRYGEDFEQIGSLEGQGTTQSVSHYRFRDDNPINGVNYYRIMQVDNDGTRSASNVVSVNHQEEASLHIYPNPFENEASVEVRSKVNESYILKVLDVQGRTVRASRTIRSNQKVSLGGDLAQGVYLVRVSGKHFTKVRRIVKTD